jgi:O-antigen/teichoic acid export membrane protein
MKFINTIKNIISEKLKRHKNSMIFAVSTFLVGGINAFTLPLFTRILSQADYGILSVTTSVQNFSTAIFRLGVNQSVLKQLVDYSPAERNKYLYSVLFFSLIWSFLLFLFIIILNFFGLFKGFENVSFYPFIVIAILSSTFTSSYAIFQSELRILNLAKTYLAVTLFYVVCSVLISIILVMYFKMGVLGKLFGNLIPDLIILIFLLISKPICVNVKYWLSAIKFGTPLGFSAILSSLIMLYAVSFLTTKLSLIDLGIYQVIRNLGLVIPEIIFQSITLSYVPFIYKNLKENKISKITKANTNIITLFTLTLLGLFLLSPYIILMFTTTEYLLGADLMRIFIISYFFKILYYFPIMEMYNRGKTMLATIIELSGLIIFVLSLYFFIDVYGLKGAGIAFFIQEIFKGILFFSFSKLKLYQVYNFANFIK